MRTLNQTVALGLSLGIAACASATSAPDTQQPRACTEIGCSSSLTLGMHLVAKGKYTIRVNLDGETVTCMTELPLAACDSRTTPVCDTKDFLLTESGCALSPDQHSLGDLMIMRTPKRAQISIERDGASLGTEILEPRYSTSRPNGPGCEPTCTQASAQLRFRE